MRVTDEPGVSIVQVATGLIHTCALLSNHTVKCWGFNGSGQLGRGDYLEERNPVAASPVSITTDPSDGVEQLVVGQGHTCVLLASKAVKCWGRNNWGQLGLGHTNTIGDNELPSSAPAVQVTSDAGIHVVRLESGPENTCALLSNGHMKCWGKNHYGELGTGWSSISSGPLGDNELPGSTPDTTVTHGADPIKQLAVGYHHACLLLASGTVKCWGRPDILGYGAAAPQFPQRAIDAPPVSLAPPGASVTAISAGRFHTCALISDGSVRCWGVNLAGRLGLAHTNQVGDDELPSDVPAIRLTSDPNLTAIALTSAQAEHNCAILSDGSAKCWGESGSGALGYTNTTHIGDDEHPDSVGSIQF